MTELRTAMPIRARIAHPSATIAADLPGAERGEQQRSGGHPDAERGDAVPGRSDPPPEHDVERPEQPGPEDGDQPDHHRSRPAALQADPCQQHHAGQRQHDAEAIPPAAARDRGDRDGSEKLDGDRGTQRQMIDRDVEAEVHRGQHAAERGGSEEFSPGPRLTPGPTPGQQDRRAHHDAQPADDRRRGEHEQAHGQCRTVVLGEARHQEQRRGRGDGEQAAGRWHVVTLAAGPCRPDRPEPMAQKPSSGRHSVRPVTATLQDGRMKVAGVTTSSRLSTGSPGRRCTRRVPLAA